FLALGSFGWAIAQRGRAQTLQERMVDAQKKNKDLLFLIDLLKGQVGQTKWAPLVAPSGAPGIGTAIIFSAPKIDDILFMDIPLVPVGKGPFMVQLVDGHRAINAGHVKLTAGGHLVLSPPWFTTQNLGKV